MKKLTKLKEMTTENINLLSPSKEKLTNLLDHFKNGRIIEAEVLAKSITKEFPSDQFAWKILGAVFKQTGRINESIIFMHRSVELDPQDAEAHNNLGVVYQELGRLEEAEASYTQAIILQTKYIEAFINLGNVLKDQGKFQKAVNAYKNAISLNPDYADAHYNMGLTLKLLGKLEESNACYIKAIELNPNHSKAYNNLGNVLQEQGKTEEAIEAYKKALLINPDYVEAYNNIGTSLKSQGKLEESINLFKKALLINPNYAYAHNNLGNVLKDQGKLEESIKLFKKAILVNPDYSDAHNNMGNALKDQGKLDEAIDSFEKAISLEPNNSVSHKNLSFAYLNKGRLQEGLHEYEWRLKTDSFKSQLRRFSQPMWDGKKRLNGKRILIWCEQGIGDTINWASCLSQIAQQADHCILECQSKLVSLLKRSLKNVEVKVEHRSLDLERNDFDFHLPMGSLYKHFIEHISQNIKIEPHLIANSDRVNFWKNRLKSLGNGPYIGISWKSSNVSPERLPDFTSISKWHPILNISDVTFINLQYDDFFDDLKKIQYELGVKVHNFNDLDHFDNIDDVAALCSALDMVVSTKSTVPLISAGVGTSTKLAVWRQSSSNNILLNPLNSSVDIYERNTWEPWEKVFNLISKDILKKGKTK